MKTLKILVAGMALLIVIGIGFVGWGVMRNASKSPSSAQGVSALPTPPASAPAAAPVPAGGYFAADVTLPPGSHLEQMSTTADRVILRLVGPDGDRILVLNPANGHVAGTVTLVPQTR